MKEMRQLQLEELDILLEFRRLCEKYDLTYYLVAGTLLGAVRHQGFIPWDDDVDVAMPRSDFNRLEKICVTDLNKQYFYQSEKTEKGFFFCFSKIRKRNSAYFESELKNVAMRQGCYIDIFPLDNCFESPILAKGWFKLVEVLECALRTRMGAEFKCAYKKKMMRILYRVACLFPAEVLLAVRRGLLWTMRHLSTGYRLCTIGGAHDYPRETYLAEWLSPPQKIQFEGHLFSAPGNWKAVLANMYGDYMTPPPDKDRGGHLTME